MICKEMKVLASEEEGEVRKLGGGVWRRRRLLFFLTSFVELLSQD